MSANSLGQRQADLSGSSKTQEQPPTVPAELESVNTRLGRLKDDVLPSAPYLLTVPTDVPFRLGNRFVNNWAVGKKGPFAIEEQQLQYMTFLMHNDTDSLLVAVGDWSDNEGRVMAKKDDEGSRVATPTTPAAPQSGAAKKKISLSDYKTRAKGDSAREQTTSNRTSPHHDTKKDTLQVPSPRTGKERTSHDRPNQSPITASSNSKRPLKDSSKPVSDAPSQKRARLTPPESAEGKVLAEKKANGIPALLSPTLPPTSSSPRLPELLSPTLPPGLEEELANIEDEAPLTSKRETTSTSKVDNKNGTQGLKAPAHDRIRIETKSTINKTQPKEASKTTSFFTSGKTSTSNRDAGMRSASPYAQKSPLSSTAAKTKGPSSTTTASTTASTTAKKLIVKLKYGRANRKRVGALLKFGGKRTLSDSVPSKTSKESFSGDEDETKMRGRKRERSPDDDHTEERPPRDTFSGGKTVPSDKVKTSNATSFKSPASKRPAVSKTDSAAPTPVKDSRSKHQRLADADPPTEVKTPLGGKSLPTKPDKAVQMSPSNDATSARDQERKTWRDEYTKYSGLGRELKHLADRYSRTKATNSENSTLDGKLAAAHGIESILCFIIAFIVNDRHRSLVRQSGDSETWRSIIAYWRVVERTTSAYPHLHGLCLVLGAVSHDTINTLDLERLAVCPLPGEQSPVPTPGSDGNTVTSSDRNNSNKSQNKKEFLDLRSRLPENHKEANRLWLEGCRQLADDVLIKEYPETWSSRSRNYAERGHDSFKIGHYAGGFYLPFGRTTTPMETVRFGVSLLREWCKKENIEFKARLKL
ncbi:conserved hypothetical protein [Talaromyces stipitatus ATCC 10500]|uniref:Ell binding protein Ebp1 C-terminal domain-containing protein n=1 Tax=Talaromyces stipitatus (strain ATCC 10500 / CBS 375.48 / QM 6759 / NRRL 1006) TaxID=441959 RepID=B8MIL5_TALSN|nr:uncharacterized protein TSTA_045650 [Talaromyces stipitatus ATCC 10500]EED15107.1 conserved hypothetical protein [Talaromyces stipitatus ATCC 10500]